MPPHYANPTVPEIPGAVRCFGEEIVTRLVVSGNHDDLVAKIKQKVAESVSCFEKMVVDMSHGEDVASFLHKLRKIHERMLTLLSRLELVIAKQGLSAMQSD